METLDNDTETVGLSIMEFNIVVSYGLCFVDTW